MDSSDKKYQFFDYTIDSQNYKEAIDYFYISCESILSLTSNEYFESIFYEPYFIDLIEYFLEKYPSPFDDTQVVIGLQNTLQKINYCVLEILKKVIFKTNEDSDILKTDIFKRYISFYSIFSIIRIFGHSVELSTSVAPLINKMIHLNYKLDSNIYFTPNETLLSFLKYFTQNVPVFCTSADFIYQLMDFLFVLETLLNLETKKMFINEFVIQFLQFFDQFLFATEKNEIQFKDHINISAVKIIDALINGPYSIEIDHLDLIFKNNRSLNKLITNFEKYGQLGSKILNKLGMDQPVIGEKCQTFYNNANIISICSIFPYLDPLTVKALLDLYSDPDILVSKLIDDPNIVNQITVKETNIQNKKLPVNTIIVKKLPTQPTSNANIKEINLKLVDTQNKEYSTKIEQVKRGLMRTNPVDTKRAIEYDDDFDESDEDLRALNVTSFQLIDEMLMQDPDIKNQKKDLIEASLDLNDPQSRISITVTEVKPHSVNERQPKHLHRRRHHR